MIIQKETDGKYIRIDDETGEIIPKDGFQCDTLEKAEWVMGQLLAWHTAALAAMQTEEALEAQRILAQARANAERAQKQHDRMLDYFKADLLEVAKASITGKSKMLDTRYGRIQLRASAPNLIVTDEGEVLRWAKAEALESLRVEMDLKDIDEAIGTLVVHADCARVKFMPSLSPVNAKMVAAGTPAPPGMTFVPSKDECYVKLPEVPGSGKVEDKEVEE